MPRNFETPEIYKSEPISILKKDNQGKKKDFSPFIITKKNITFKIARYFGFCFGVENAIEIAYRAVRDNPDKRVFLLSEMIHNPVVNNDLISRGVKFIQKPDGTNLVPFESLTTNDVVILPAFGVSVETFQKLEEVGIDPRIYDATCPFVEKVWRRSAQLGEQGFTVIVHGKHFHEETRATFSHAAVKAPVVIIRNMEEAQLIADFITKRAVMDDFHKVFEGKYSKGFDPQKDLMKIGVVNQTTMLAEETRGISDYLRRIMLEHYGSENIDLHFADTKDTLCYATSENQTSVKALIESGGDIAIVVGGRNSSNTSHLAKLFTSKIPAFHIEGVKDIFDNDSINHIDFVSREFKETRNWFPQKQNVTVLITAGASTPDSIVESVINRVVDLYSANS